MTVSVVQRWNSEHWQQLDLDYYRALPFHDGVWETNF